MGNRFGKGDRVVMVDVEKARTDGVDLGNRGTVLAVYGKTTLDVFVDWDDAVVTDSNGTLHGCKKGHGWWVNHEGLDFEKNVGAKPTHVIVMKYDGDKTTAIEKVNGKIVAKAEAHRNPADDASSSIGFKVAFERLMEEVSKEDESKRKSPKDKSKFTIDDIREGDFVKIKDDLKINTWYGSHIVVEGMLPYRSNIVRVNKTFADDNSFNFKGSGYRFTPEMVEDVYHASGRN